MNSAARTGRIELCASGEKQIADAYGLQAVSEVLLEEFYFVSTRKIPLLDLLTYLEREDWDVLMQAEVVRLICGVLSDLGRFCVLSETKDILTMRGTPRLMHQRMLMEQQVLQLLLEVLSSVINHIQAIFCLPENDLPTKSPDPDRTTTEPNPKVSSSSLHQLPLHHLELRPDLSDDEEHLYESLLAIASRSYAVLRLAIWGNSHLATSLSRCYLDALHSHILLPAGIAKPAIVLLKYIYR
jgi:hypothetical protein